MLQQLIEAILPPIISTVELVGIFIVSMGAMRAFYHYMKSVFQQEEERTFKYLLFHAMATGLEFKMAAEILKTVLIREIGEIFMLGAIILLRGLIAFMISAEMRQLHPKEGGTASF